MYLRHATTRRTRRILVWSGLVAAVAVWWIVSAMMDGQARDLPGPDGVSRAALAMFAKEGFLADVGASTARVLCAFLVAALLALPFGLAMSLSRYAGALFTPLVEFIRYIPVPALLPLFVVWSGIGETPKFLVLFVGTFFQLVLLVADDVENIPQVYFDTARTLGATEAGLLRRVVWPYVKPQFFDRCRVALGWCWTYLVIAELLAAQRGVGHAIKEAQRFNSVDRLVVCFVILGLIGLATDQALRRLHGVFFPYAQRTRNS